MNSSEQEICWDDAEVAIEVRYGLKRFLVNFVGPFARLGSHPRCEIRVPFGQNSVLAYMHVVKGGLAVVVLPPEGSHRCRTQFVATGDSLSLTSPITISVVSNALKAKQNNPHSVKQKLTFPPDALLLVSGSVKGGLTDASFLIAPGISILGRSESCQLKLRHRTIAPYQCAIIRSEGSCPRMRIVDFFSPHSTKIGGQIAQGEELFVEDVLTLGKMLFTAGRHGNRDALMVPVPEQHLNSPHRRKSNEMQFVDSRQELEIVNHLSIAKTDANQQVEVKPPSENQLLLLELARNVAALVARVEKIEFSLGCIPKQIEELRLNTVLSKVDENTIDVSDNEVPVHVSSPFLKPEEPERDSNDHESQAEDYVLGKLIELRTRTDNRRRSRLFVAAVASFVLTALVVATVWNRVPSGWRERIWQFSAFSYCRPE